MARSRSFSYLFFCIYNNVIQDYSLFLAVIVSHCRNVFVVGAPWDGPGFETGAAYSHAQPGVVDTWNSSFSQERDVKIFCHDEALFLSNSLDWWGRGVAVFPVRTIFSLPPQSRGGGGVRILVLLWMYILSESSLHFHINSDRFKEFYTLSHTLL